MIVELINIQSIQKATYEIEEKGVVQIIGDNSNGKSILIKAMSFVATTLIKDKEERETIINDDVDSGIIIMSRKDMTLKVYINRELSNCRYELVRANGTVITRSVREGGLEKLADEFGWATFKDGVCLQIFETFGTMPFVNNRASGDYEIVDYIITDRVANNFIEAYKGTTNTEFSRYASDLKTKIAYADKVLSEISFYNIVAYENILYKLKAYQRNVSKLFILNTSKLPITRAFKYVDVPMYSPRKLPVFRVLPSIPSLLQLTTYISNLVSTLNGVCPICNTKFKDMEEHVHDI